MAHSVSLSVIFLVVLAVSLPTSDGIRFAVTPSNTVTERIKLLSFHCLPNTVNPSDIIHVRQIRLQKYVTKHLKRFWDTVAFYNRYIRGVKGHKYAKRIQIHGRITRDLHHSFLRVDLKNPTPADSGTYRCDVWLSTSHHTTTSGEKWIKVSVKKYTSGAVIG